MAAETIAGRGGLQECIAKALDQRRGGQSGD